MPKEEFLTVKNAHPTGSGRPPVLQTGQGYLSYFENDRREQWDFILDWESEVFFLAGGNLGNLESLSSCGFLRVYMPVPWLTWRFYEALYRWLV